VTSTRNELRSVYERAGGEAGIELILKDFYRRMSQDVMIGHFFDGKNTDEIAMKQKLFLMRAMGASATYPGKAPALAHVALPKILSGHFDRRLRILEATLTDHGLPLEDIRSWVELESAFRPAIVQTE
jgi:hemoglobin